jgi:hypothetical protein
LTLALTTLTLTLTLHPNSISGGEIRVSLQIYPVVRECPLTKEEVNTRYPSLGLGLGLRVRVRVRVRIRVRVRVRIRMRVRG